MSLSVAAYPTIDEEDEEDDETTFSSIELRLLDGGATGGLL